MAARRRVVEFEMSEADRTALLAISRSRSEKACRIERARLLLAYREPPSFYAVGRTVGVTHQTVSRCVERARARGVRGVGVSGCHGGAGRLAAAGQGAEDHARGQGLAGVAGLRQSQAAWLSS